MSVAGRILFINLKRDIVQELKQVLSEGGIQVFYCHGYSDCLKMARLYIPNLFIISENNDPARPGLRLIAVLRENSVFNQSLIVYLTDNTDEESQMEAFKTGADDVITKGSSNRILAHHITSLMKRFSSKHPFSSSEGNLMIDLESFTVMLNGKTIPLVKKEFELLQLLYSSPNRIFNRQEILQHVWKDAQLKSDRTLNVHIRRLRQKLGIPNIKTINGMGYKYEWDADPRYQPD